MKKTCPKKITSFNYMKTVEPTYTRSILITGYPHGRAKNDLHKKSNSKTKM